MSHTYKKTPKDNFPEITDLVASESACTVAEKGCVINFDTYPGARGEYGGDFKLTKGSPNAVDADHALRLFHCAFSVCSVVV